MIVQKFERSSNIYRDRFIPGISNASSSALRSGSFLKCLLGLAIAQFRRTDQAPFSLRIGIDNGPVVAGVIGLKKFSYDLWGDAVNVASRMESQGQPDRIQVTQSVYECLKPYYHFEDRGFI